MTELIWDGKYDKDGRRVAPVRVALPFQTVETVNESAQQRQRSLDLFGSGGDPEWRNRLIWGDKKYVLPSLLPELAGKVDLIYIDPPFDTGADFSLQLQVEGTAFTKEPSIIEQKAYRDTWGRGIDSYIQWIYESTLLLRELLSDHGSIYIHIGQNLNHVVRNILDEGFGYENVRSEIIWKRADTIKGNFGQGSRLWGINTDSILFCTKSDDYTFHPTFGEYSDEYIKDFYKYVEADTGRRYRLISMIGPGGAAKGNPEYAVMGTTRHWRYSKQRMEELVEAGLVVQTSPGTVPVRKQYLDEGKGVSVQTLWDDVGALGASAGQRVGYPTQKPEALLERIIKASSNEGDLVLDCFSGSGTTAAVAEKLGRRWIAADLGRFAVHTTRKRLLSIPDVTPFVVQNLGKYERQAWQAGEFGGDAARRTLAYRQFILDLYHARPLTGYAWLHGVKGGRYVHVGAVDSPVTPGDVTQIASEFRRATGTGADAPTTNGVDVLGWDFAFEMNEVAKQQAALAKIALRFVRIPREVLEKKAVEQGDIRFFELAALGVEMKQAKRQVSLTLSDFVIPLDDVPEDIRRAITHWAQWIDYWAVDWDNKDDTFHNEWQTYRTRKVRTLERSAAHTYDAPGTYTVVVKVIDILGNDTTKTLRVEVV